MKKIKYLATTLLLVLTVMSCTNDGGSSNIEFPQGAAPNFKKIATTDQSIDIVGLKAGGSINLGLTLSVARGDVASMKVIGFYTKGGVTGKGILKDNITTFPATVNITQNDLYNAFTALNSANDITISDKLVVSSEITLNNGTIIKMYNDNGTANYGADLANSTVFSISQTYVIACPIPNAATFNGTYKVAKDDWADYSVGDEIPVVYDAAFGTFKFKILNVNNPYIANPTTSYFIVTIDPATSKVVVTSNENFDYGPAYGPTTGTGTVASCTGDIDLKLAFGPYGTYNFNLVKK